MLKRSSKWIIPVLVGVIIWISPQPEGVSTDAWHLLAIFIATILGIIFKPFPMGVVAIIGITVAVSSGIITINAGLSAFSNRVIWLIVIAFFISRGFIKTGLGERIAYAFMRILGKSTIGLAYGMIATDLVLAPAIPSITARSGGVIFPLLRSISKAYGSEPDRRTSRKLGAFLIKTSFQGTVITGCMFLTGMAANPLAAGFALEQNVDISWGLWALGALIPGILSLLINPLLIYKIYPPEIKRTPEAAKIAKDKLKSLGKMKRSEWSLLIIFLLLLLLWIFGKFLGIHSTTAGLAGLSLLLITGTLSWEDILSEKGAWNTLVWFSALVMMATQLNELGFITWLSEATGQYFSHIAWQPAFLMLALIYFYSHYFFASSTAHVSAMYLPFLSVAIMLGTPAVPAALVLGYFSNLYGGITHYGLGPGPVLFGAGYIEMKDWWRIGGILSVVNIFVWLFIGGLWWKILNLW